jgi:hypothetical protein
LCILSYTILGTVSEKGMPSLMEISVFQYNPHL